jgi:hypothetical protein
MHLGEPGYSRSYLDYLEALVAAGRLAGELAFLGHLDSQVAASGRRSAGAAWRCQHHGFRPTAPAIFSRVGAVGESGRHS